MPTGEAHQTGSLRTVSRRGLLSAAAVTWATGVAALAGCGSRGNKTASGGATAGGAAPGGAIKRGGTLMTFLTSASSDDFEPHGFRSESANTQPLLALVYSGLLRLKLGDGLKFTDRTMEGVLAAKWEQPDPQTLVFHLRPGVKFQDKPPVNGRELTASDVKFSFERMLASPFPYLNYYSSIASVDAPDEQTATMKLKAPDAALLGHLAIGFCWIVAKEAGKMDAKGPSLGMSFGDPSTAIGSGPFMVDAYEHGVKATFVRNPAYFETGLPYLDRVEYQFLTDISAQLAALQTGQAIVGNLPLGSEIDFRARNPKLVFTPNFSTSAWHHVGRVDQKPFGDVRVRQALAMAYNQDNVKKVWGVPDTPSSYGSLTAVTGDAYLPLEQLGDAAKYWKFDPNGAKQLLASAGYPNGFETPYTSDTCCAPQFVAEAFVADMAKIGVKIDLTVKEHAANQASTLLGKFDGMAGNQVPVYDANDWFSLTMIPGAGRNLAHMDDPQVNDLVAKQRSELDVQKRLDIIHQLVRYLAGQAYYLVEPQAVQTEARWPFVKNYSPRIGYQPTFTVAWLDK